MKDARGPHVPNDFVQKQNSSKSKLRGSCVLHTVNNTRRATQDNLHQRQLQGRIQQQQQQQQQQQE
ncbi:uncharacterized protein PADG_02237 [Paracoccidioides brasiliensis Pb18]|uniref:Uncharacterized protein n=2 Tax=Paracoccidioides brasiliensis TaxID=121759 RepID=C1G271_PARBD|nr:uncharacterized protein PADG_02237 [Paracoccidioides brasiliensis Pb18]EEH46087.2 hypothetical protein PADG_02237 [Paracoccidioides brasiliensis Pb18]ODH39047.1 hypothetical protein ACO22_02055 [Paracoccidioides brasiliensis]